MYNTYGSNVMLTGLEIIVYCEHCERHHNHRSLSLSLIISVLCSEVHDMQQYYLSIIYKNCFPEFSTGSRGIVHPLFENSYWEIFFFFFLFFPIRILKQRVNNSP